MKARNVDIVFVIDASRSMQPCFEGLAKHLDEIVQPLQGFNFQVRLGLVAVNVGRSNDGGQAIFTSTLAGRGLDSIYGGKAINLFTTNGADFAGALRGVRLDGDENNLYALDFALDFPFGSVSDTRRVIALFSDEKIEDGDVDASQLAKIPLLVEKITARKVLFFAAMPISPALEELATADGSQIEPVSGGDGLATVDFRKLMSQMAKSISAQSAQGYEASWQRALFDQDKWGTVDSVSFDGMR
jgi:hypothetical protein